ncbi:hypothetical protein HYU23_02550 [Candidatus Woesearchaeota archaeon]|nr:hypothetical protein [Candidatus Woesearchaeota archaeon]
MNKGGENMVWNMMGYDGMMYGGTVMFFWSLLLFALLLGLTVLVWVLVVKFWKEARRMK